jgi:hypothetical protein
MHIVAVHMTLRVYLVLYSVLRLLVLNHTKTVTVASATNNVTVQVRRSAMYKE